MQKTDFNRDWTVQKDGSNEILHVNLPDDAMIREERSKENKTASASAYFAGGKYIYTKIFNLSGDETRQTLILEFEAVYQNAIVFLNGRQVAEHPYGYKNFRNGKGALRGRYRIRSTNGCSGHLRCLQRLSVHLFRQIYLH